MKAIDIHIHMQPREMMSPGALAFIESGRPDSEIVKRCLDSPKALAEHLDKERISKVGVINYVAPDIMGFTSGVNQWAAEYRSGAPDRIIAFGGIHPPACKNVKDEMRIIFEDCQLDALKIHPPHQDMPANAYADGSIPELATVYEMCQEYSKPVLIHTGTSTFPGARSKWGNPMEIDDIAIDFPDLKIIMAHGGRPLWINEAWFVFRRHKNVYWDLASIPPKRMLEWYPRLFELGNKVIFGTDWPSPGVPGIRKNLDAILSLPISQEDKDNLSYKSVQGVFDD